MRHVQILIFNNLIHVHVITFYINKNVVPSITNLKKTLEYKADYTFPL